MINDLPYPINGMDNMLSHGVTRSGLGTEDKGPRRKGRRGIIQ